ncbi:hypothetical protein MCOR28_005141 [Pyricularia oryzae]|nr:hypothetical protein MCOR26_009597 [Pyricularia oryzae]KAI6342835.1 hypothetical protein MCOR28_005141 [Pyricularia oryzae]
MQFPQIFIMIATVFAAAAQAICTDPVNGECPKTPGVSVFSCRVDGKIAKCCDSFVKCPMQVVVRALPGNAA